MYTPLVPLIEVSESLILSRHFEHACAQRDASAVTDLFTLDGSFFTIGGLFPRGKRCQGMLQIESFFDFLFKQYEIGMNFHAPVESRQLCERQLYQSGYYTRRMTVRENGYQFEEKGMYVRLLSPSSDGYHHTNLSMSFLTKRPTKAAASKSGSTVKAG